ncbi:MAG: hypothetical protein JST59_00885 [Actinobacteria bacterium]|nr:hypothetical protein [Actinomycetota bacterium]
MFQLINNLKECAQLNRDFRENLLAALPAESYELFRSSEKFFVAPCMDHYQQTYLEVLLIEMLCGFGLFELLPLAVAFNCLLSTVQSYTSCFRSLRDTHFEQVEAFFVKYPKLQRLEMDAVVFAAKILTPLLKQAEDFAVLYDKQLDEDRKQALLRSCRILATEVIACYEGFLTNDDYHRH